MPKRACDVRTLAGTASLEEKRNHWFRGGVAAPKSARNPGVARAGGCYFLPNMPIPHRKVLLIAAGVVLLAALTANLWVGALADAVIDQAVLPFTRLVVDLLG